LLYLLSTVFHVVAVLFRGDTFLIMCRLEFGWVYIASWTSLKVKAASSS